MDRYNSEEVLKTIRNDTKIKLISFDIFDTLIFRCVNEPKQIFSLVGHRAKEVGVLPSYFSDIEFENLRVEAEKKARKIQKQNNGYDEVTLEEIYTVMPKMIQTEFLLQLEIDTEIQQCYANSHLKDVIEELYAEGRKIVLTSDMYLSTKQVERILVSSGYKLEWFDCIFMSSEYKVSKYNGQLYQIVLNKYEMKPEEVIHIGDNYSGDVLRASFLGIKTYHYDIVNKDDMILEMEKLAFGSLVPHVASIRKILNNSSNQYDAEKNIWYQMGASIMGPVLTGYAEWILETTQSNNIKRIFPLMREGKLISSVLEVMIKERNLLLEVKPMYISRRSMLLPSMDEWNSEKLDDILELRDISIKDIFDLVKIDTPKNWDNKYGSYTIREAKKTKIGLSTLEQMVKEYLLSSECTKKINENIKEETELAYGYLMQISKGEPFLTADLGFKGSIQTYINRLFKKEKVDINNIHLLLLASLKSVKTFMEGVDIRGFVGTFGRNGNFVKEIAFSPYIFEILMMCDEGTTIGYKNINEKIVPIKKDTITASQKEIIQIVKMGIIDFEKEYLKLQKEKNQIKLGIKDSDDLMKIIYRLYRYPTIMEAKVLSELQHENMGVDSSYTVCKKEHLKLIKEVGLKEFNKRISIYDAFWIHGLLVQCDPMFYYKEMFEKGVSQYETKIVNIVQEIVNDKTEDIIIIGAGEAGQKIKKYIDLYKCIDVNIRIEAFIDNNRNLQGSFIDGIEVKSFNELFQSKNYVIGSFAYTNELLDQLYEIKGTDIKVYCSLAEVE